MNTKNTRRWAVIRRNTGSILRKFATRNAARAYRRSTNPARLAVWDGQRGVMVR
jgi:hypothetical protein